MSSLFQVHDIFELFRRILAFKSVRFLRMSWICNPLIISDHQYMFQLRVPAHFNEMSVALMLQKRLNTLIYPSESTRSGGETETKPKVEDRVEAEESIKKVFILNNWFGNGK